MKRESARLQRSSSIPPRESWGRGLCVAVVLLGALLTSCGGGGDGSKNRLPRGALTASDSGPLVLFTSEAGRSDRQGNRQAGNRVSGYRLGTDGLLPLDPFTSVSTADNPRSLLLVQGCEAGEPFSTLYVATLNRVQAYAVADSGAIVPGPLSETAPEEGADGVAITAAQGHLYVAAQGASRVDAYLMGSKGALAASPTSCARGLSGVSYGTVEVSGNVLFAGGLGSLDAFALSAGELPGAECASGAVTERTGSIILPRALDLVIKGSRLYVSEEGERRIFSVEIQPGGALPLEFDNKTASLELFERLLLDGTRIYASAFSAGKIMAFELEGGLLPRDPFSETQADSNSLPVGLARNGDFLYVAQAGADRVDAFAVDPVTGTLSRSPVSSTAQIADSFPNDIVLGQFPPPPCL